MDHQRKFEEAVAQIDALSRQGNHWIMDHRQIDTPEQAAEVAALRQQMADIKLASEDARDAERLPLIEKAQAVQAKWAPRLAQLKQTDDLLRHAEKAWKKRQRQGAR
jgi:hypothetical protein